MSINFLEWTPEQIDKAKLLLNQILDLCKERKEFDAQTTWRTFFDPKRRQELARLQSEINRLQQEFDILTASVVKELSEA